MRPMYESLATVMATFPEIVNGHLLRSIVLKCIPNLKFVALLAVPRYAHAPFCLKF